MEAQERRELEIVTEDSHPQTIVKPVCQLTGANGNIFNLMGIASRALKQCGLREHATDMCRRIMGGEAHSYDEALVIIMEYVDVC